MRKRIVTVVFVCAGAISLSACGGDRSAGGDSAQVMELPAITEDTKLGDDGSQEQTMSSGGEQADTEPAVGCICDCAADGNAAFVQKIFL
ncbi:MAG: hypothetical protein K2G51_16220 [Lachnospiraceae bacterium]|nr:hypothetical protein [Lachnospiraceae bacterium]MDE7275062.1 hypothetical protein [Lachnospiraceae bacterium]